MYCENYLCIYQDNERCTIDEISLDVMGMCTSCIYPNIEDKVLKELKKETLESMEGRNC